MPVAQQGLRQVRTDEPCAAGYECLHEFLLSDHRGRPPIPLGSAMVSIAPPPGTRRSRVGGFHPVNSVRCRGTGPAPFWGGTPLLGAKAAPAGGPLPDL